MRAIYIRVPHVRDSLIVANMGGRSHQNMVAILSGAHSAERPDLSEVEAKDLRLSSSPRRTC